VDLGFAGGGGRGGYDKLSYLFCGIAKELFNIEQVEIVMITRIKRIWKRLSHQTGIRVSKEL
jgi:hypothetical protein